MSNVELKPCPFCGGKVELMNLTLPVKMFYCLNYTSCGAVVSFNNPICDHEAGDRHKIRTFNRQYQEGQTNE